MSKTLFFVNLCPEPSPWFRELLPSLTNAQTPRRPDSQTPRSHPIMAANCSEITDIDDWWKLEGEKNDAGGAGDARDGVIDLTVSDSEDDVTVDVDDDGWSTSSSFSTVNSTTSSASPGTQALALALTSPPYEPPTSPTSTAYSTTSPEAYDSEIARANLADLLANLAGGI